MVHKRFQNMESTFRANERKIRESRARCSGKRTDKIYKPKWEYYNMLLFLKRTCAQSDSIDNLSLQNHTSLIRQEIMNCSLIIHSCNKVQNSPNLTNIYCDKKTEKYMFISPNLSESNDTTNTNNSQASPVHSEAYISPQLSPNSVSNSLHLSH